MTQLNHLLVFSIFRKQFQENITNMGLDSVELVIDIENYFGIRIPDKEAERLDTVQKMVDSVAFHLNVFDESKLLQHQIFLKVKEGFRKIGQPIDQILLTDSISNLIISLQKDDWEALIEDLNLDIPKPEVARKYGAKIGDKLKSLLSRTPAYDLEKITVEDFVNAICGNNYETLIERTNIKCKYEIYVAVVGITVQKIGVDYYEVTPEKSFTNDLGVD